MGGGNPGSVQCLFRNHGKGKTVFPAIVCQQGSVAGASVAEAEIVTADKTGGAVFPAQQIQKAPPGSSAHGIVEGQGDHMIHPLRQQPFPIAGGIDQTGCHADDQSLRMHAEGYRAGAAACAARQIPADFQQPGMAQMDAVKKTQSKNRV